MYLPGIRTDHMAFCLTFDLTLNPRGPGYWKFNNSLLKDNHFLLGMNENLETSIQESKSLHPIDRWIYLKKAMQSFSKKYSKAKVKETELTISQLSEKLIQLQSEISQMYEEHKWEILCRTKSDLEELLSAKTKAAMFRTKSKWYEQGEIGSKYFLNMEKRRYNSRVCNTVKTDHGLITAAKRVLKEQEAFYSELYRSDSSIIFNLENTSGKKVTEDLSLLQEQPFTQEEIGLALKNLQSNKTPGEDGLSPEVIKMFYKYLKDPLYAMITTAYQERRLPDQLMCGIINLIPKSDKDSRLLKNLRPITLLNTDYKVIEKTIANKLEPALQTLINQDQRGFMKERRISVNIRKIFELIQYCTENSIDAMILSMDFQKCFDKIEKNRDIRCTEVLWF